jgi:hypothetical protein
LDFKDRLSPPLPSSYFGNTIALSYHQIDGYLPANSIKKDSCYVSDLEVAYVASKIRDDVEEQVVCGFYCIFIFVNSIYFLLSFPSYFSVFKFKYQ